MSLLWKRANGKEGKSTSTHSCTSREEGISVLIDSMEKGILTIQREKYALFEWMTIKNTRVFNIFPEKHGVF